MLSFSDYDTPFLHFTLHRQFISAQLSVISSSILLSSEMVKFIFFYISSTKQHGYKEMILHLLALSIIFYSLFRKATSAIRLYLSAPNFYINSLMITFYAVPSFICELVENLRQAFPWSSFFYHVTAVIASVGFFALLCLFTRTFSMFTWNRYVVFQLKF